MGGPADPHTHSDLSWQWPLLCSAGMLKERMTKRPAHRKETYYTHNHTHIYTLTVPTSHPKPRILTPILEPSLDTQHAVEVVKISLHYQKCPNFASKMCILEHTHTPGKWYMGSDLKWGRHIHSSRIKASKHTHTHIHTPIWVFMWCRCRTGNELCSDRNTRYAWIWLSAVQPGLTGLHHGQIP